MVIYRALTAAVVDNNNFHENYDRRRFLSLDDTRRRAFFRYPLMTSFPDYLICMVLYAQRKN